MKNRSGAKAGSLLGCVAFVGLFGGMSLLATEGCTVTTGNGPIDFDSGRADSLAPPPPGNAACNGCLFQQCGGQWAVCQQSDECMAIYQCAIKTGCDGTCVRGCYDAHPTGQKGYTALYTCDGAGTACECSSQCNATRTCTAPVDAGSTETSTADSGTPPANDCSACTATNCADQKASCAQGTECDAYSQCLNACTDAACVTTCASSHASGKTASEDLGACTIQKCSTACGL